MFYHYNGTVFQTNCQVVPESDVSGVGVRWALFVQVCTAIILSAVELEPSEILLINIATEATALALMSSTFFDPTVDVCTFSDIESICRPVLHMSNNPI